MIGMGGVATAIDSIPSSYTTLEASGKVYANDSYILHGGYFGLECNWEESDTFNERVGDLLQLDLSVAILEKKPRQCIALTGLCHFLTVR